jgi:HEAT repeat protein
MKRVLVVSLVLLAFGCARKKSTEYWVYELKGDNVPRRLKAVKTLGDRGSDAITAVPALADALQDPDAYVRRDAARALGKFGPQAKPAVPSLTKALEDTEPNVRKAAAQALLDIDPDAARQSLAP